MTPFSFSALPSRLATCGLIAVAMVVSVGSDVGAASSKKPVQSTPTTVAKGTAVKGTAAKGTKAKKGGQVLQPGKPLQGWDTRGPSDWPAANVALVAEPVETTILVRRSPDFSTPGVLLSSGGSVSGTLGLLIVGERDGWWKVLMPVRPNGTVGWVQQSSVDTKVVKERVVVDLSNNTITVYRGGKVVRTEPAATGTSGTPTPDGLFFVKSIVPQSNPNAGRGPFVLVLSGFSEVLNTFDGGQGAVGIHGTGAPSKIGQKVSHGCVRVRNETIIELAASMQPGTPVEIYQKPSDAPKKRWSPASTTASSESSDAASSGTSTTSVPGSSDSGSVNSAQPPVTGVA
jgi:lipoprotein-anchoring transpeptidase ErfK/SrfK